MPNQSHRTLQLIGVLKLVKGFLLIALATGGIALLGKDLEQNVARMIRHLHMDPGNHYFKMFLTKVVGLSPRLPVILIGSFVYGTLFTIEGLGLLWQKRWAEYLTAIVTGSFLPLEGYELYQHRSVGKALVIALNIAILVYLIIRLRHDRQKPLEALVLPSR